MSVGAATRLFALLGGSVSHSLSPRFQNAAFAALGADAVYVALACAAPDLPGLLLGLARAGGGGNVTFPHKALAARTVECRTDAVAATGACNTFWLEDGRVRGDNTDVEGVRHALTHLLGAGGVRGARVLLLGAGDTARTTLHVLRTDGAGEVVILNRSATRAAALRNLVSDRRVAVAESAGALRGERFDLAVNATPVGMAELAEEMPLPMPARGGVAYDAVLDLAYAPGGTAWVRAAHASGLSAADGTDMLLGQGAAALRRWLGAEPPLEVMRAALAAPLER